MPRRIEQLRRVQSAVNDQRAPRDASRSSSQIELANTTSARGLPGGIAGAWSASERMPCQSGRLRDLPPRIGANGAKGFAESPLPGQGKTRNVSSDPPWMSQWCSRARSSCSGRVPRSRGGCKASRPDGLAPGLRISSKPPGSVQARGPDSSVADISSTGAQGEHGTALPRSSTGRVRFAAFVKFVEDHQQPRRARPDRPADA